MPRLGDLFPSKWLKASDLDEDGLAVTIKTIDVEKMNDGEEKAVVYFKEISKGLALNKTNAKSISKLYGDDTDDWEGKKITIFPSECDFKGETVDCIRVKTKAPKAANGKAAKVAANPSDVETIDDDDDPPF